MKKLKTWQWVIIIFVLIVIWVFIRFILGGSEDDWIKDSRGVWIKHGNPSSVPAYVLEQQEAVNCALSLYNNSKNENIEFNSQCLGDCGNYAVDIVHVPRTSEDNLEENQCLDYKEGKVNHFIELEKNGSIVRAV